MALSDYYLTKAHLQDTDAALKHGAEVAAKQQRNRELAAEAREVVWARYHLLFPENGVGLGPWANEHQGYNERKGGSFFGFGLINNPFSESEGDRRVESAKLQNAVRRQVRQLYLDGKSREEIAAQIPHSDNPFAQSILDRAVPLDLWRHYKATAK